MVAWLGPALSAGASIIGGIMGSNSQKSANRTAINMFTAQRQHAEDDWRNAVRRENNLNKQAIAFAREQATTAHKRSVAQEASARAYNLQMDRTRVQRLVNDAKAAGIHPLAALGANLNAPIAQAVQAMPQGADIRGGGQAHSNTQIPNLDASNPMGDAIGNAVANLAPLFDSQVSRERSLLENQLLRRQIAAYDVGAATAVADATSRTLISGARAAATGGPSGARYLTDPSGRKFKVGPGTSAQDYENEYGEASELDQALRWIRDRVLPNVPGNPVTDPIGLPKLPVAGPKQSSSTIDMMLGGMDKFR